MKATAYAHTNIALVKYWGKRDPALNLPATGSISLTLEAFGTQTTVELSDGPDAVFLDGAALSPGEGQRVSRFLDIVRAEAKSERGAVVRSTNDVPTAAGLASSASGFCALAAAASAAYGLKPSPRDLSILSRRGSGSAARSVYGGFARMNRGARDDGTDAFAEALPASADLDVRLLVVQCATGKKKVSSTVGMNRTEATSPLYPPWVETHASDMEDAERALRDGDFAALGTVMEHSTLKMHASALGAKPGLWYFMPPTVGVMNAVRALRDEAGDIAYFTMDAGPHVKVLTRAENVARVGDALRDIPGVVSITASAPGPGVRVETEPA